MAQPTPDAYIFREASTLDQRRQHRQFLEETLRNAGNDEALRDELRLEIRAALTKEDRAVVARMAVDNATGTSEGTREGISSGSGRGSVDMQSGGNPGGENYKEASSCLPDLETIALLMFMAQDNIMQRQPENEGYAAPEPIAAATLMFDREENVAQVYEPYMPEPQKDALSPALAMLPALEKHALHRGANIMQLRVHPEVAPLFEKKMGYKSQGKVFDKTHTPMVRMRKWLIPSPMPSADGVI